MARTFDDTPFENLRTPTEEEYNVIAENLKLSAFQKAALARCISITLDKCRSHKDRQIAAKNARLDQEGLELKAEKIRGSLAEAHSEIESSRDRIAAIGTIRNLGLLGRMLSVETLASFKVEANIDFDVLTELEILKAKKAGNGRSDELPAQAIRMTDLEASVREQKALIDVAYRPELLLFLLSAMIEQFDGWLKQINVQPDKGGPSTDPVRLYFIYSLACDARDILSKPIRKSGGKAFLDLCSQVFPVCGMSAEGLEQAIKRHLKKPAIWHDVAFYNELDG
jgi:hypothetical protein